MLGVILGRREVVGKHVEMLTGSGNGENPCKLISLSICEKDFGRNWEIENIDFNFLLAKASESKFLLRRSSERTF